MARIDVKSATRVLEILECFSKERACLSQKDIVRKLKYPQSSAALLLRCMVERGYMCYDRRDRVYFPSPEVAKLGGWLGEGEYKFLFERSAVTMMLEEIRDRTQETVALSTMNDTNIQWHRMLHSNLPLRIYIPEGKMYPLSYSSHGWVMLSARKSHEVQQICQLINSRQKDPAFKINIKEALEKVTQIRARGYYYQRNMLMPEGGSVSMLLPTTIVGRPVAIGAGGPSERIEGKLDEVVKILRNTVAKYRDEICATFEQHRYTRAAEAQEPERYSDAV